jgi:hypothetical protein
MADEGEPMTHTTGSSFLDGSPTPEWVEDCRRRAAAQKASYGLTEVFSSEPDAAYRDPCTSEPRNRQSIADLPRRDWLAPKEEKPAWLL